MGTSYKIRIDSTNYDVHVPKMTGNEILVLAGKDPAQHRLIQRPHGGQPKPIGAEEWVYFTEPGVERFVTLPLDQTEG